jgi:DnaD/phage-associated family protein
MNYRLNPDILGEIFAVPAAVADQHIKLAGSAQLKVLLWLLRNGQGVFDAALCSKAIGLSPADCCDALQFWFATGILLPDDSEIKAAQPSPNDPQKVISAKRKGASVTDKKDAAAAQTELPKSMSVVRPRPVKPSMKEVIRRQKQNGEFAYLLDTASARLGRPITNGDMETLLYLFDTAGMPVEVILMVIEYAVAQGKSHMRYIEKVALDWSDRGIDTIAAAEQYLCSLERRNEAWNKLSTLLGLAHSPTIAQSEAAEIWIQDWQIDDGLLRLAYEKCMAATRRFNSGYMMKIIEHWRADGIDTVEKAMAEQNGGKKNKGKPKKATSFDLDEYETMVSDFTPVYTPKKSK